MKEKNLLKKIIGSCLLALCMISAVAYAEDGEETKSVLYESNYTYNSTTYVKDGVKIAPEKDGYLFAGWFTSEEGTTYKAVSEPQDNAVYYAKFVPEEVLTIKAQVSDKLYDENTEDDSEAAIRFVTTIDKSKDYEQVGFNIKKGSTGTAEDAEVSNYVYRTLYAVDATDTTGTPLKKLPEDEFHATSYYFKTWTIKNIGEAAYNTDVTVTPYWITVDGTRVEGTKSIKTVNLGRSWIYVENVANADGEQYGTRRHPYTTVAAAINVDTEIGKTVILKSDMNVDATVTIDENVTLTSESGATLTRTAEQTGNMFDVTAGTFTIQGSEGKEVVIDGNIDITAEDATAVKARAVNVAEGATFQMTNGIIQNFYSDNYSGAAIMSAGSFDIDNSQFMNNRASGAAGGAIYASGSYPFTITGCTFTNNQSGSHGGAIYSKDAKDAPIQITNCCFTGNIADNTASNNGGAVYVANNNILQLNDSSFYNNKATRYGGAVGMGTGTSDIVLDGEVIFEGNVAEGEYHGGAVMTGNGFTINKGADIKFNENAATDALGGALYFNGNTPVFTLEEGASLVMTDNRDKNGKTDIAVKDNVIANITLKGSYEINRIHAVVGTEITLGENAVDQSDEKLTMVYLTGTVETGNQLVTGSATANTIFEPKASKHVTLNADGSLNVDDYVAQRLDNGENKYYETLTDAMTEAVAGDTITVIADVVLDAMFEIDKSVTITSDSISRTISFQETDSAYNPILINTAGIDVAFAGKSEDARLIFKGLSTGYSKMFMYLQTVNSVTMENVDIIDAKRSSNGGAAIYSNATELTLTNCTFENCVSTTNGGAIVVSKGTMKAEDCTFSNCSAGTTGGAINSSKPVILNNCYFVGNESTTTGGAININTGTLKAEDCTFSDCTSVTAGGAIYSNNTVTLIDCDFSGNETTSETGGAVSMSGAVLTAEGCTFSACTSKKTGGAIHSNKAVDLTGCTFTNNKASTGGGAVYVGGANALTITECTFTENTAVSYGGAVAMGTGSATMELSGKCEFTGNQATGNTKHFGGAMLAPATLHIKTGAVVEMTGNDCTGYDYGDAISLYGDNNKGFIIESGAALYVWDNPNATDSNNDVCLYDNQSTTTGLGRPIEPTVNEGGVYSTVAPTSGE